MFAGRGLTDEMRSLLYTEAYALAKKFRRKKKVRHDRFEGTVRTEYKYGLLGEIGGIIFHAVVESDAGTTKVDFLVTSADLPQIPPEDGIWASAPWLEGARFEDVVVVDLN